MEDTIDQNLFQIGLEKLLREEPTIRAARAQSWPKLQRILVAPRIEELLAYCEAVARVIDGSAAEIHFCWEKLSLPADMLNPQPLITGDDLVAAGYTPGATFKRVLDSVYDAQLEDQIRTKDEAMELSKRLFAS